MLRYLDKVLSGPAGIAGIIIVLVVGAYLLAPTSPPPPQLNQPISQPVPPVTKQESDNDLPETPNTQETSSTNSGTAEEFSQELEIIVAEKMDFLKVNCWKYRPAADEAVTVRSRILASHEGANVAFSEVELSLERGTCNSKASLYARSGDSTIPRLVFTQNEEQDLNANMIRVVDWSPSGQFFLAEVIRFMSESDVGFEEFLVFDIRTQEIQRPKIGELFAEYTGKKHCYPRLKAMGFSEDTGIIFEAFMPYQDDTPEEEQSDWEKQFCNLKTLKWKIGFLENPTLVPMPDSATVERYGVFQ